MAKKSALQKKIELIKLDIANLKNKINALQEVLIILEEPIQGEPKVAILPMDTHNQKESEEANE